MYLYFKSYLICTNGLFITIFVFVMVSSPLLCESIISDTDFNILGVELLFHLT